MRVGFSILVGLIVLASISSTKLAFAESQLVFGVVPQQSASRLARIWLPVTKHLSSKTGFSIRFATAKDIPTFEACLAGAAYDIAYMNPYHYVVFHEQSGYRAIAHQQDKKLKGILVTRKDANIETLTDLQGKAVAFPSPAAFGASILPRAELRMRGIEIIPEYVESHDSVYRAVASGFMVAGGGVGRTWRTIAEDIRKDLRIFYETGAFTPHAFAVLDSLRESDVKLLQEVLVDISVEDPKILESIGMSGIVKAQDSDWDDVRALSISKEEAQVNDGSDSKCHSN